MTFVKYQHIERFGTDEVEGIDLGTVWIFPKLDGTNASVWLEKDGEDHKICAGSRSRELDYVKEKDNHNFHAWVSEQENIREFLEMHPFLKLYGEFLIPHTLKTYREDAWRRFYVFDVVDMMNGEYLEYSNYSSLLQIYDIDFITPLGAYVNPSMKQIEVCIDRNTFMIEDGKGVGEGVVLKNYKYVNKYGRITWAKIVRNEFKEEHVKVMGHVEGTGQKMVEDEIVKKFITESLVEKVYSKISLDEDGFRSKHIPRLHNTVYHDLIKEDTWNFIKIHRNPVIDFKKLQYITFNKIKDFKSELF